MSRRASTNNKAPSRRKGLSDAKVVMVGDSSIGKTSLLLRYMEREFTDCSSTIGAAFVIKTWGVHDIAIWDTAGEEKYAGMTTFYYRNATAAVLTFDMFDRASFQNLIQRYIPILEDVTSAQLKVIVATKSDLLNTRERKVTQMEGKQLARRCNPRLKCDDPSLPYFETSAKTGHHVDEVFEYIFRHFFPDPNKPSPFSSKEKEDSVVLDEEPRETKFNCCR